MVFARKMDRDEYLSRIGLDRSDIRADAEGLGRLELAHLLHVPFENLDIHWKRPIVLDTERFYSKIVIEKRGGFCYELIGLFNELLREIGFRSRLVSARPFNVERGFGPEFDHAAIVAKIGETEYLVDVGFGNFSAEPLLIVPNIEQSDREGVFRISPDVDDSFVVEKMFGVEWIPEYLFSKKGRNLDEFAEMCNFQQYSADSHFVKGKICSQMTEDGRKTLTDKKFIVTSKSTKKEKTVVSEEQFNAILEQEFGIRPIT